jgi:hypothetical protein
MPKPSELPTNSRFERFVLGFFYAAVLIFVGVLFEGSTLFEAFIAALLVGATVGALGAVFGQRVFQFLLDLLGHL